MTNETMHPDDISVLCAVDQNFAIDDKHAERLEALISKGLVRRVSVLELTDSGEKIIEEWMKLR